MNIRGIRERNNSPQITQINAEKRSTNSSAYLRGKNNPKIDEEIVRHYLLKLDLEEERLRIG